MIREPRKPFALPFWAEASLILVFAIMAIIESLHAQWFFAIIFGLAGCCFGIGLASRLNGTDKNQ